jgi:hypothetical protein
VLTADKLFGTDCEKPSLPPTIINAFNTTDQSSTLAISSVGDAGNDPLLTSTFNMVLRADPELTHSWRNWFNYTFAISKALSADLCSIPYLAPARGTIEAMQSWQEYQSLFTKQDELIAVQVLDETTGEITLQINGKTVTPFDDGKLKLDAITLLFQKIYKSGSLVTIDESSRLKPIAVPVKAMLLDEDQEKSIGAVTRKQSFTLHVLDKKADKRIEKCRSIGDVLELLTISLSNGNRWIPESAKEILNKELDHRHKEGLKLLLSSIGVSEIPKSSETRPVLQDYIKRKADLLCKDLDSMYQELGKGNHVPPDKVVVILNNAISRLETALSKKIPPSVIFNQVLAPDLSPTAPDSNWAQPLEMLYQTSCAIRKGLTDQYFNRAFKGLSFTSDEFLPAIDVFGDCILKDSDSKKAEEELGYIQYIFDLDEKNKKKCELLYSVISNRKEIYL